MGGNGLDLRQPMPVDNCAESGASDWWGELGKTRGKR